MAREIIDLSHELYTGMPNIAGAQIAFWPTETHAGTRQLTGGKLDMESRMMLLPEHSGTHVDAPRHCDEAGLSVAEVPLERLCLPGHLLDLTHKRAGEAISVADLEAAAAKTGRAIGGGCATICWTGTDRHWGQPGWTANRPHIPTDTAQWLVEQGMTLFATDMIGMDDPAEWWWPTHAVWLKAGICMVQQLRGLDRLAGKEFLLLCLPLKMRDGTGCPVRAAALVL
jgi:arylformamidase